MCWAGSHELGAKRVSDRHPESSLNQKSFFLTNEIKRRTRGPLRRRGPHLCLLKCRLAWRWDPWNTMEHCKWQVKEQWNNCFEGTFAAFPTTRIESYWYFLNGPELEWLETQRYNWQIAISDKVHLSVAVEYWFSGSWQGLNSWLVTAFLTNELRNFLTCHTSLCLSCNFNVWQCVSTALAEGCSCFQQQQQQIWQNVPTDVAQIWTSKDISSRGTISETIGKGVHWEWSTCKEFIRQLRTLFRLYVL